MDTVRAKLRAFRTWLRTCVTVEGLAWTAAVLVVLVALSLLIDYTQRLGLLARQFCMAVGIDTLGFVFYQTVWLRLKRPMDERRLALAVEDKFPQLRDRLISALQFAAPIEEGSTGRSGQSVVMMRAVSDQAAEAVVPLDLGRTLNLRRVFTAVGVAGAAWALLLGFSIWQPGTMGLWFRRNVLLGDAAWPQRTHLAVRFQEKVPKGDTFVVTVQASGEIPATVTIDYKFLQSGRKGEEVLKRLGLIEENRFEARFKHLVEPLEFQVSGGDATTEWYTVSLVERPDIRQLKFWAVYPHYTRMPSQLLSPAESFLEVLPGTRIKVAAVPTKPLVAAWMNLDAGEKATDMTRADDQATRDFWFSAEEQTSVPEFWTGACKFTEDCSVAVNVRDTDDLLNRPPTRFTVKIVADKEPLVALRMKGIGEMVVPKATIPLEIKVTDDFGIASLRLKHRFMIEDKYAPEEVISFKLVYGGKELVHEMPWHLEPLGLQPGSVLLFRVEATDYKDVEPRNVGATEEVSVRVVTPEELMADLVRRQVEQSQDFRRVRDRQRDEVKIEIDAAARALRDPKRNKLSDDERTRLIGVEQTVRHSIEEIRHITDVLEQVVLEMTNNKVGEEEERAKLRDDIVAPCRELVGTLMPALADDVKAAAASSGPELRKRAAAAVKKNEIVLARMDLVFNHMLQMATYRSIVEQMRKLKQDQEELFTDIERERKKLLESILGVE
jgi:hypothetical protein